MLYLNARDMTDRADYHNIMDAIEKAYRLKASGSYTMPPRIHLDHGANTILYMPCFFDTAFGTKIISLFPGNAAKNLPMITGIFLLNDAETGKPLAILDGGSLTALRTGAVGGVAVRHIVPQQAETAGLIGAGTQGYYQLLFAAHARKLKRIVVYNRTFTKAVDFCARLQSDLPAVKIEAVSTVEEVLKRVDLVITATPALNPVLPDDEAMLRGKSYIGIGSYKPEMREFPQALYRLADHVLVDTLHGLEESGDLITPLEQNWISREQVIDFSDYLGGKAKPPKPEETKVFKSVGMALFDLAVGELLYRRALDKGLGIELFNNSCFKT